MINLILFWILILVVVLAILLMGVLLRLGLGDCLRYEALVDL